MTPCYDTCHKTAYATPHIHQTTAWNNTINRQILPNFEQNFSIGVELPPLVNWSGHGFEPPSGS